MADNQQTGLQRSINRLIEQRIGLLEKEIEVRKKAGEQVSAAEKDVAKLRESQKKTNDVFEWGERIVKKYAASLTTLALAHRAYKIAVSSSRGETEHFIQSAQRLDSVSTSIKEIGRRAREYQEVVKNDIKLASRYGMELDKVKSVSDGWIKQQRFVGGYTREQQQELRKLTELTIQYSKVLGVDSAQLTQQAAKRMFQYGESAEEALHKIGRMRSNVEVLNATMSKHFDEKAAYLWVDDFSNLVNEAAGSTRGFIHDLDALSAAMAWSATKATEAKLSYNQALNAAKAMGQFVTGGGNENAMSTILGLRFLEKIKKSRGPDGKLSEDFLAQFNESQRAELQKITSLIGTTNEKDLALYIADALASSKMGIRELLDLTNELGASSGDIVPILMQQRGLNRQQAIEIARQLKEAESLEAVAEGIAGQYKKAADENERMHSEGELKRLSRAEGGKVFAQLPYVDAVWERTDELIGGVKAHFADFGNVAKYALAGAALAAAGFVRSMGGIKGLTGTFAGIGNFGRSMATGGVGGMTSAAIASGTRQALLPYSAGGALRVLPMGGTMGAGGVGGRAGAAAAAGGGYYYAAGGGMGKKGYTAAQRAAIAREVGARRAGEMGIARGGAAAPAARAGMGARMGGLAKNPMTMLAAFMLGSMALAPDAEAAPDSGKEKAKALGSKGLNAAMLWSMFGFKGAGAIGAKLSGLGSGIGSMGSGLGTGATAIAGTGAAAAVGTAGIVGAAFAAPMALFAYGFRKDNKLKHIRKMVNGPLTKKELGTGYRGFVEYLAEHPDKGQALLSDGTISKEMYHHSRYLAIAAGELDTPLESDSSWRRMFELEKDRDPYSADLLGATQQGAAAVRASTSAQAASRYTAPTLKGAAGRGQITNVSPGGAATIKVPIEFEVGNALAIPAEYDRQKTQYQS